MKMLERLFASRFVPSYLFKNTDALAGQISLFDYAFSTEPFNFNGGDCVRYNHGLPNTFFDFCALLLSTKRNTKTIEKIILFFIYYKFIIQSTLFH